MAIPSEGRHRRGQRDGEGFARTSEQMRAVWDASDDGPPSIVPHRREDVGSAVRVVGALCPHDDYLYAGRVYRDVLPALAAAGTIIVVGVFHAYRRFDMRDRLVFEDFARWRTPDGDVTVSPLREQWIGSLPSDMVCVDSLAHEYEHSIEALVYWLHHQRPGLQVIPVLVPAMSFERMCAIATTAGDALAAIFHGLGWTLGRDVAVALSGDAVHYGADFRHTPFGDGGVEPYARAVERDLSIMADLIHGDLRTERARELYETFVDPNQPDQYRVTWCGRFAIPFGWLLLETLGRRRPGDPAAPSRTRIRAEAVAYATSVGWPELPVRHLGLGVTAPANLYHFVGYPGAHIVESCE